MSDSSFRIRKAIVHILDNKVQAPVLSDFELSITPEIGDFLKKHVNRIFEDIDNKKVFFKQDDNFVKQSCMNLNSDIEGFIDISKEIASSLYELMLKNVDIPSADVVFIVFDFNSNLYMGILKFNYKQSFIHFIDENTEGRQNKIIRQKTTLPSANQKINEAVIINLKDYSILLKEKKYNIDGNKQFYLSKLFLNTTNVLSDKEKINIVNKASKKILKKYYNEDLTKAAEVKNVIAESVQQTSTIDLNEINTKVFSKNPQIQNEYIEEIKNKGIEEESFIVSPNVEKRVSKKHKIITDNNIEIKLPPSYLTNKEKVEFITNPDGSLAIVLKDIRNIKDK